MGGPFAPPPSLDVRGLIIIPVMLLAFELVSIVLLEVMYLIEPKQQWIQS